MQNQSSPNFQKIDDNDISKYCDHLFVEESARCQGNETKTIHKQKKSVQIHKQRKILMQRLKIPPPIHQFDNSVNSRQATQLLTIVEK